ncbi:MAG: protease-4, partial [Alphaproteobacteria bacterium]
MSDKYQSYSHYYQTKKTRFWRAIAFTVFICACIFCAFSIFSNNTLDSTDYIAEIAIDGMIVDASNQAEKINDLYDNDQVKAVIIAINSPGGTTYDSEILYDALAKVSQKKPVVAYMKNIAASGGYIVAIAAEKIFAAKNTITGSIGVLMQVPNAKKLLDNIGVS